MKQGLKSCAFQAFFISYFVFWQDLTTRRRQLPFRNGEGDLRPLRAKKHPEDVCPRGAVLPSPRRGKGDRLRWMRSPRSGFWIQLCRVWWDGEPSPVPLLTVPHPTVKCQFIHAMHFITGVDFTVIKNIHPCEYEIADLFDGKIREVDSICS